MPNLIIALVVSAVAFSAGWLANGWRLGEQIEQLHATWNQAYANQTQATLDKERELNEFNRQVEVQHATQVKAINDAYASNLKLADAVKRMQQPTRRSNGTLPANHSTCQYASTAAASDLSTESVQLLVELAREADDAARYANTCHQWAVGVTAVVQ
jgi:hypothetical protein